MELYPWQKEALSKWEENHYQGIVDVITGAGKTYFALAAIDLLKKRCKMRVLIVVPTIVLANQWRSQIRSFFPELEFLPDGIAMVGDGKSADNKHQFTIYVVNSARYVLSKHLIENQNQGFHTFLICDECHHYGSEYNSLIFRFAKNPQFKKELYHCLGLSATPYCVNFEKVLLPNLGEVFYTLSYEHAVKEGVISQFYTLNCAISLNGEESSIYGKLTADISILFAYVMKEYPELSLLDDRDFFNVLNSYAVEEPESPLARLFFLIKKRRKLLYDAQSRYQCLYDLLEQLLKENDQEKIIIFTQQIDQSEMIYISLREHFNIRIARFHSGMDKRQREMNLSSFRNNESRILIACKALDEGFDVPDASIGIVFSSSTVFRQHIQRLGRIIRRSDKKEAAFLYYLFINNTVESSSFIDTDTDHEVFLRYSDTDLFYCEKYASIIVRIYESQAEKMDESQDKEFMQCAKEGMIRADYLLNEEIIIDKISASTDKHTKNYWLLMKRVHKFLHLQ